MNENDIQTEQRIRSFSYLSDLFKHTEAFNLMGHQIGRKVGDMLELVVMAKIYSDPELAKRIIYEPKMVGATGAGHKVEFGFYESHAMLAEHKPFGFIECKKVGVEVTKDSSTRNGLRSLNAGDIISMSFKRKWINKTIELKMTVSEISSDFVSVVVSSNQGNKSFTVPIKGAIRIVVTEEGTLHIVSPSENLRDIKGIMRICKYINLETIQNDTSAWSLFDCLTGPQTIEKAKQASLVAMDVRKMVDGKWGRDDLAEDEKSVTSILVLTEASHWEEKSRKVITTCIDHNIIVPDEIIVEAFRMFEVEYGLGKIMNLIRKSEFIVNPQIRDTLARLLGKFENKLFYDLNLGTYVDFHYNNGKLIVKEITSF